MLLIYASEGYVLLLLVLGRESLLLSSFV